MLAINFLGLIIGLVYILIFLYKRKQNYWVRRNVPQLNNTFPWGHIPDFYKKKRNIISYIDDYYKLMKSHGYKVGGFNLMLDNNLLLIDPVVVHDVLLKKFDSFTDRNFFSTEYDPLTVNLLSITGNKWKKERSLLTGNFTPRKIKLLIEHVIFSCNALEKKILKSCDEKTTIDINDLIMRFLIDLTGRIGFGYECNSLSNPDDIFKKFTQKATDVDINWKIIFISVFPNLARILGIKMIPVEVTKFVFEIINIAITHREKNNVQRNDMMQLLIQMMEKENGGLSLNQIAGHGSLFFIASFETTSLTLIYCIFELSKNQEVQDKARNEIKRVLSENNFEITYEILKDFKYIQQVINETLRIYPVIPYVTRTCTKDYLIPGTDVVIEKKAKVLVSIFSLQRDPEYFPDPEKFDPDRFSDYNKSHKKPCTFMPFGEGPRNCIGKKLANLQVIIALITILKKFKFTLNSKTPENISFTKNVMLLMNSETVYVDFEEIND